MKSALQTPKSESSLTRRNSSRSARGVKLERESLNFIVSRYAWTLDKKTAAGILGVTRATVYAMIRDGRLSELPDGRISASSVADYMDGNGGQFVPLKRGKKRGLSA